MILVIDNYDSFVYNLARYVSVAGWRCKVVRNDKITLKAIQKYRPLAIVISPGPCTPKEAGISVDIIKTFGAHIPILGVCLGHQCIGEAYGGKTIRAKNAIHGKASSIMHSQEGLYHGLPSPLRVGRYHSLVTQIQKNSALEVNAHSSEGEIMGFKHKEHPVYGIQFHPESVLTEKGFDMIYNFSEITHNWHKKQKVAA